MNVSVFSPPVGTFEEPSHQQSSFCYQGRLGRPDLALSRRAECYPFASIRTVHAATLFGDGAVLDGDVHPAVKLDLQEAKDAGITALYVIGMWEATAFSELWTKHWAPTWPGSSAHNSDWIGASVFSTDDYVPNRLVGSWENLDRVLECAKGIGITIIPCFVTNTIGMGGALLRRTLREQPQSIMYRSTDRSEFDTLERFTTTNRPIKSYSLTRTTGPSPGEHTLDVFDYCWGHTVYRYSLRDANGGVCSAILQINGDRLYKHAWVVDCPFGSDSPQVHCVQLGSEDPFDRGGDSATVWSDTVHRSVHLSETRYCQMKELAEALRRFPAFRCDMAHLAGIDAWADYLEIARNLGHGVHRFLLETYFEHGQLVKQDPAISTYANFIFDWLSRERMNVPQMMSHVHDDRSLYQEHRLVAYVESHDDKGDENLAVKGAQALIIAACPVESVLWGQNQRYGDPFRIGAQWHIPRSDLRRRIESLLGTSESPDADGSHADYHAFFRKVESLSALPVFRDRNSIWRKATFVVTPDGDSERIFHIVREYNNPEALMTDRVVVVVDARNQMAGHPLQIDVATTFQVEKESLAEYVLVDLIEGDISPANDVMVLSPRMGSPEPHSFARALVKKVVVEELLR